MPDESTSTETENEPGTETPPEGAETGTETPPEGDQSGSTLSHEDALKEVSRVRAEAAGYRTKLRDAEQKLANAKTPEEIEAVKAEFTTKIAELEHAVLVGEVARAAKLPDDLAAMLTGKDKAELEASAKVLAKYVTAPGTPPGDLKGGLSPDDNPADGETDPRALQKRYGRGAKR